MCLKPYPQKCHQHKQTKQHLKQPQLEGRATIAITTITAAMMLALALTVGGHRQVEEAVIRQCLSWSLD
jgi:hypothetical protein